MSNSTVNSYEQGTMVTLSTLPNGFVDTVTGLNADPGNVTLSIGIADSRQTWVTYTYGVSTIVKDSVGNYHADIDTTHFAPGVWTYQWQGSEGGPLALAAWQFIVLAPPL